MSDEVEIGRGKRGRRAYTLDDIALVPSRRTRDPEDVNVGWQIDAYHVDIPLMAAPMDSVMSPETAIAFGRLGGIGVLDLDGLWTRYEDPTPILDHIAHLGEEESIATLQRVYSEPIKPSLITARLKQLREAGVVVAGKLSPQRVQKYWRAVVDAGVDLFIIRGSTVSAEHVSSRREPLNLKRFLYELDVPVIVGGVCTDTAALHLMRTGAAGVLVGFGGGAAHSTRQSLGVHAPMATWLRHVRTIWMSPAAATCTSSRTAASAAAVTWRARSRVVRTPSCSALPSPARRRLRDAAGTGDPRRPTRICRAASASTSARRARLSKSSTAPRHARTAP